MPVEDNEQDEQDEREVLDFLVRPDCPHCVPTQPPPGCAGIDLRATRDVVIQGMTREVVATGLRIALPPGTFGQIVGRHALAALHALQPAQVIVENEYREEIKVIVCNLGMTAQKIAKGERFASLIVMPYVPILLRKMKFIPHEVERQ